jgi:hypothetical protein
MHIANSVLRRCLADGGTDASCAPKAIIQANGAVGAPKAAAAMRPLLTIASAVTVAPRLELHHGQEFLIAPCVMLIAGVLNQGLVLNTALVPTDWNGVPVVIGHPKDARGTPISARDPAVLATCGVGQVFHARLGRGQREGNPVLSLVADLWLNLAQVGRCGLEAAQAIDLLKHQQGLEVSTAFFPEVDPSPGDFYGTPYVERYVRLRPDHLALLPHEVGACSLADGCGAPRVNDRPCACGAGAPCLCTPEDLPMPDALPVPLTRLQRLWQVLRDFVHHEEEHAVAVQGLHTAQTDLDLREALCGALAREADDAEDAAEKESGHDSMFDDVLRIPRIETLDQVNQIFTYYDEGQLMQRGWSMVNGVVTLDDTAQAVQRSTTYTVVPGGVELEEASEDDDDVVVTEAATPTEEESMATPDVIQRRVNALIANERTRWTEGDRHMLETQDEAFLIRLEQQPLEPAPVEPAPPPVDPGSWEEALQMLPPHLREPLGAHIETYERRKAVMIDQILTNKLNIFSQQELQAFDAARLEKLLKFGGEPVPGEPPQAPLTANYNGRRMPPLRIVQTEEMDAPPPPPDTLALVIEERKRMGLM